MFYNFKFANDVADQTCVSTLKTVEDEASKYYRVRERESEGEKLFIIFYRMLKINRHLIPKITKFK